MPITIMLLETLSMPTLKGYKIYQARYNILNYIKYHDLQTSFFT